MKNYPIFWIERFFDRVSHPYLAAGLIAVCIPLIYWLFSFSVPFYDTPTRTWNWVIAQPFLIGLELAGLCYFLGKIRHMFGVVLPDLFQEKEYAALHLTWTKRFYYSWYYYLLILLVFFLPVLYTITHPVSFSNEAPQIWGSLFDFFNVVYYGFKIVLLGTIIWILINIALLIHVMGESPYQQRIHLNIMAADSNSGLKPIYNLYVNLVVFYFVAITLENINSFYFNEAYFWGENYLFDLFAVMFFICLIIVGLILFIYVINSIRKILRSRIEEKINEVSECYGIQEQNLMNLMKDTVDDDKTGKITSSKGKIDVLYTQRERLLQLYSKNKGYTFVTLVKFGSSFILASIAFLDQVLQFLATYEIWP